MRQEKFRAERITDLDGVELPAGNPNYKLRMPLPGWAQDGDLIRRRRPE